MADEPDPPRKFFQLKPTEFERMNPAPAPAPAAPVNSLPASPTTGESPPSSQPIDVRELVRHGAVGVPLLSANQPANRPNEVHAALQEKFAHEQAAGLFHVEPGVDKQRRLRLWSYWLLLTAVDLPLAIIAFSVNPTRGAGPASATVFVCAIGGIGMFTAFWTWHVWFLRTER